MYCLLKKNIKEQEGVVEVQLDDPQTGEDGEFFPLDMIRYGAR